MKYAIQVSIKKYICQIYTTVGVKKNTTHPLQKAPILLTFRVLVLVAERRRRPPLRAPVEQVSVRPDVGTPPDAPARLQRCRTGSNIIGFRNDLAEE